MITPVKKYTEYTLTRELSRKKAHVIKDEGITVLEEWVNKVPVLENNDCSRLHKLIESQTDGSGYEVTDNEELRPMDPAEQMANLQGANSFVLTHDWGGVFAEHLAEQETHFRLPFPKCCFEMKISGLVILALVSEAPDGAKKPMRLYALVGKDFWVNFVPRGPIVPEKDHFGFIQDQIVSVCIALEAEVAEHEMIRAPHKLNEKRVRNGKLPLSDYHIVSLARKHRARPGPETAHDTGRKVRMHFRRGHWRHFETTKTWIKWMLVGNPDLGFINKHYKL